MRAPNACAVCACLLAAIGCAGSGEGLDANGRPIGSGGAGELTPDLASIQANVFTPICTQCHAGAAAAQGLRLDEGNSYNALVGVPSSEQQAVLRVRPGNPAASYLVQKLEGRASVGERMPLAQPPLPEATVQVIRQWISDGALRGTSGASAAAGLANTAFVVELVNVSPSGLAVAFSRGIDATLLAPTTVSLEQVDARPARILVPARASVSPVNEALLLVQPDAPLTPGRYVLRLSGAGPVALADWNAVALDGDGDGRPGGDHLVEWQIEGAP